MGRHSNKKKKTKPSASQSSDASVVKQPTDTPIPDDNHKTLGQWICSWSVVSFVLGTMLVGGGYSFMTSGAPYIADLFFITSGTVFLVKFITWEFINQHNKKIQIILLAIIATTTITSGMVIGNHQLNKKKHTNAFLQIRKPLFIDGYSKIGIGKKLGFNIVMDNLSSERLFNVAGGLRMYIVENPDSQTDKYFIELSREAQKEYNHKYESEKITGRAEMGKDDNIWSSIWTEPLSEKQCIGLLNGSTRIYITAWGIWRDAENNIDTAYNCKWLQALPSKPFDSNYSTRDLVWHTCYHLQ